MQNDTAGPVEVMARAWFNSEGKEPDAHEWLMQDDSVRDEYRNHARAVLAVLVAGGHAVVPKEPTAAMLNAALIEAGWKAEPHVAACESGVPVESNLSEADCEYINKASAQQAADIYRAMLQAVQAEGQ